MAPEALAEGAGGKKAAYVPSLSKDYGEPREASLADGKGSKSPDQLSRAFAEAFGPPVAPAKEPASSQKAEQPPPVGVAEKPVGPTPEVTPEVIKEDQQALEAAQQAVQQAAEVVGKPVEQAAEVITKPLKPTNPELVLSELEQAVPKASSEVIAASEMAQMVQLLHAKQVEHLSSHPEDLKAESEPQ